MLQYPMIAGKFLFVTSFTTAQSYIMPVVIVALLLDSAIVGIWYLIGVILGSDRAKSAARSELYQLVGTFILALIIISFMTVYGGVFFSVLGQSTQLMSSAAINSLCANVMRTSPLSLIGSSNSLLSSPTTSSGLAFKGICGVVSDANSQNPDLTTRIDYPLAAAATIIANITNQTAANVNAAFIFDAYLGFLNSVKPSFWVCTDDSNVDSQCLLPIEGALPPLAEFQYYFMPYAGYDLLIQNLGTFGNLLTTSVELLSAQLYFVVMCLYIWPYLLFIGLVLRSTLFTRPLGGLFIAVALVMVLVFPATYAIEYLSLSNSNISNSAAIYGFNSITQIQSLSTASGTYTLNFFVQPNMKNVISNNGCWPSDGNLLGAEVEDLDVLLVPFYAIGSEIVGLFTSSGQVGTFAPDLALPQTCYYKDATKIFYQFLNAYGIMGIDIYLLPLLNIIIAISSLRGLSGLMGGDTDLAGLARLVP